MKLVGELGEGVLPGVLRTIYVGRRTGMLHVTCDGERTSLCFIGGHIVYGCSTVKEARLGETLVRHGLLTEWDQARAAEMVDVTGRRLGEILLDLGILDADRLEEGLGLHVRELLLTAFSWKEGGYAFEDQERDTFRGYDRPLRLSTGEVILDAVWSITDPDVIRYGLGDLDRVLAQTTDPLLRFQRLNLSPTDGFMLSRVDGILTARAILEFTPLPSEEAQRSLLGLIYTGMVEYLAPRPKPAAIDGAALARHVLDAWAALPKQNHYEVLAVQRDARSAEILAAYFRLAKLYHPDAHHLHGLEQLRAKLEMLFARVTEAHRVISNPALRVAYDQALASDGSAPERASEPAPEVPAARQDPERAPSAARRRARLLKAQALLQGAGGQKAAEQELKSALETDPGHAEAHFLLGSIYRDAGAVALAATCFKRALVLRPRYAEAMAELGALEGRDKAESGVLK